MAKNVFLKTSYNYHAGEAKPCVYWTVNGMNTFLEQLKNTDIPVESCILQICAKMTKEVSIAHNNQRDTDKGLIISINPVNRKCKIRDTKNCIKCIASGKCRDEFVIDLIGKKLFADKYNQGKQEERND